MSTIKQKEANKLNAKKSTGPKTEEGKAKSSQNAITHGLTSTRTLIGLEDSLEYHQLRGGLLKDYAPANLQEEILVDRIASATWRTLRSRQMEQNLCNMSIDEWQDKRKGDRERTAKTENEALVISMVENDLWKLMQRYDTQISRDFFRSVAQLEKMQKDRRLRERNDRTDARKDDELALRQQRQTRQAQQTKRRPDENWLPLEIARPAQASSQLVPGNTVESHLPNQ